MDQSESVLNWAFFEIGSYIENLAYSENWAYFETSGDFKNGLILTSQWSFTIVIFEMSFLCKRIFWRSFLVIF